MTFKVEIGQAWQTGFCVGLVTAVTEEVFTVSGKYIYSSGYDDDDGSNVESWSFNYNVKDVPEEPAVWTNHGDRIIYDASNIKWLS